MRLNKFFFIVFLGILGVTYAWSQKSPLQQEIDQARAEIEQINRQISTNKAEQKDKQQATKLLDQKIGVRQKVINSLGAQMSTLRSSLGAEGERIVAYNSAIDSLQHVASLLVVRAYKLGKLAPKNTLMSIRAASEIETLKHKIALITKEIRNRKFTLDTMASAAGVRLSTIKAASDELAQVSSEKRRELSLIAREKEEAALLSKRLRAEERTLEGQVAQKTRQIERLQEQIRQAVESEAVRRPAADQTGFSKDFLGNKGRLRSPLAGGRVVDNYGVHDHPLQKGVKVNNKGVNLRGAEGGSVTAIFKGEVRAVFGVEGMGTSVLLRHGAYLTVYSNLTGVTVRTGQSVATGDVIGRLLTDELHFEVWQETTTLNPALWVSLK